MELEIIVEQLGEIRFRIVVFDDKFLRVLIAAISIRRRNREEKKFAGDKSIVSSHETVITHFTSEKTSGRPIPCDRKEIVRMICHCTIVNCQPATCLCSCL